MKRGWLVGIVLIGAVVGGWFVLRNRTPDQDIQFRYAKVEKGNLIRSISATGQVVALTAVDIKSKAGGKVVKLMVDEGTVVKKGDLIAVIDPSDTRATYDQASADLSSATARANQARLNQALQVANSRTAIRDAEVALDSARSRLRRSELEAKRSPELSATSIATATSNLQSAKQAFEKLEQVTIPQSKQSAAADLNRAQAEFDRAQAELERQQDLLRKGYVAQSEVDRAKATLESARAAYQTSKQRMATLELELAADRRTARLAVERAESALREATANRASVPIAQQNLVEAQKAVAAAEIELRRARDAQMNDQIRAADAIAARASVVRSRVSVENAKVQLDSTTVLAPRDGVVTQKYLEEGTIIPPGTSTFSQGTSIVQLSDVTQLFVECTVDEADISQVHEGQRVYIVAEAFPGKKMEGVVRRVNPSAKTENNITSIRVRVEVKPGKDADVRLLPGMNATCEFLTKEKLGVLMVPAPAIQREGESTYVKIKAAEGQQPTKRPVKVGESGNDGVEILEGLKEGEEIVVAEIDLNALRAMQQKMLEAQQGGGLAGGGPMGGRGGSSRASGAGGGGGGNRGGGGGR